MCPGKLYKVRKFEMDKTDKAHIHFHACGPWQLDGDGLLQPTVGGGGDFTLSFENASAGTLNLVIIDPDPGGGTGTE